MKLSKQLLLAEIMDPLSIAACFSPILDVKNSASDLFSYVGDPVYLLTVEVLHSKNNYIFFDPSSWDSNFCAPYIFVNFGTDNIRVKAGVNWFI
ncbi:hypothetical protein CEXT_275731 [Caerostris extrusa]|uniref:Uncharacterized protein n=1 Tax=Caerostris extrusa TaxID=172846 RepID=A0AAV4S1B5_CAEEX|nr:hypothetical protein CEXT_275731 [Caerostris extrusa]